MAYIRKWVPHTKKDMRLDMREGQSRKESGRFEECKKNHRMVRDRWQEQDKMEYKKE